MTHQEQIAFIRAKCVATNPEIENRTHRAKPRVHPVFIPTTIMINIPTEIIELARQGGYENEWLIGDKRDAEVALDREFWESLGRKLGWKEADDASRTDYTWMGQAQRFYDKVLSGQDTTDFWASITKGK